MSRLMDRLRGREPWHDNNLADWHDEHRTPQSLVWAIRPPCGYETWSLYRPGCRFNSNNTVASEPVAEYRAVGEAEDRNGARLTEHRTWMRPWVERVSGGRVISMVEGWSQEYSGGCREYVVFALVDR